MTFSATVLRVLIASPGDLSEDRETATAAINAHWLSATCRCPKMGNTREATDWNSAITPSSYNHLLIGMFWTRFGTSTGVPESGTVEEIDQFVEQSKPGCSTFQTAN